MSDIYQIIREKSSVPDNDENHKKFILSIDTIPTIVLRDYVNTRNLSIFQRRIFLIHLITHFRESVNNVCSRLYMVMNSCIKRGYFIPANIFKEDLKWMYEYFVVNDNTIPILPDDFVYVFQKIAIETTSIRKNCHISNMGRNDPTVNNSTIDDEKLLFGHWYRCKECIKSLECLEIVKEFHKKSPFY